MVSTVVVKDLRLAAPQDQYRLYYEATLQAESRNEGDMTSHACSESTGKVFTSEPAP